MEGLNKPTKSLNQHIRSPSRELNPGSFINEAGALTPGRRARRFSSPHFIYRSRGRNFTALHYVIYSCPRKTQTECPQGAWSSSLCSFPRPPSLVLSSCRCLGLPSHKGASRTMWNAESRGFILCPTFNDNTAPSLGCEVHIGVSMKRTTDVSKNVLLASGECNCLCFLLTSVSLLASTLKMEAVRPPETSVKFYRIRRHHIPEDSNLHTASNCTFHSISQLRFFHMICPRTPIY
jgi:hypothetical protein